MLKISSNRINPSMLPKQGREILSKQEFEEIVKGGNFDIFSLEGLQAARVAVFEAARKAKPARQDKILKKAQAEFASLIRKSVELEGPDGKRIVDFFIRKRFIKKGAEGIDKAKSILNEEEGKKNKMNLSTVEKSLLKVIKKAVDEDNENNENNEDKNDKDASADDETMKVLQALQEKGLIELDNNGEVKQITDAGIEFLGKDSGDNESNGNENEDNNKEGEEETSTEGTEDNENVKTGGGKEEHDNTGEDEGGPGSAEEKLKDAFKEEDNQSEEGKKENTTDEGNEGNEGNENDEEGVKQEEGGEDKQNYRNENDKENPDDNENPENDNDNQESTQEQDSKFDEIKNEEGQLDDDKLMNYAKKTSTADLQAFADDPQSDERLVKVAQQELADRKEGKSSEPAPNNNGMGENKGMEGEDNEEGIDPDAQSKQELMNWIDEYFDEHDIEDFRKYVTELISQSPKELKILKEHYRTDYSQKNGGNQVSEIDEDEFGDWVKEYLAHQPYPHLKDYATKLIQKNPDAFKDLQSKYENLKKNNMI